MATHNQSVSPEPLAAKPTTRLIPRWVVSLALTVLSGLLFVGAFPKLDWGWLSWIAFVPFLLTFPHRRMRGALAHGIVFGMVAYGGVLYWVAIFAAHAIGKPLAVVAWMIGAVAQTTAVFLFAIGAQWLSTRPNRWVWWLGGPALWAVLEWVRQLGELGTGWGDIAYSQHSALTILQVTRLAGVWGLAFLILLVNMAFVSLYRNWRDRRFAMGTAVLFLAAWIYGVASLHAERLHPTFKAAALQANIDQNVPWHGLRPDNPIYVNQVISTLVAQGDEAARQGAILTVTSETSFPGYIRTDTELHNAVAKMLVRNHQTLLLGGNDYDPSFNRDANAMYLLDPTGKILGVYMKRQLVPFGEYVPGRRMMPFLEALHLAVYDRKVGAPRQPVLDAGLPIGKVAITLCYESSYPELTREQVERGAGLLAIGTDDTWFGYTAAARQHACIAAVRAAETDRYLIRTAATGISQIISPTGEVIGESGLFRKAVLCAPVERRTTITPYVRFGDWFIWFSLALLLGLSVFSLMDKRSRKLEY